MKEVRQRNGHWYYTVEVSKDNYIYTLKFNEDGELVKEEADQAFPPDIHDQPTLEDIPE